MGREAGRGFSGEFFCTEEGLSWGGLGGGGALSAGALEEGGGSAFSRTSGFTEVSERKNNTKVKIGRAHV